MSKAPLVYPRQIKGASDKDYLKITIATEGGQGIYQFFDGGKGKSLGGGAKAPTSSSQGTIFLAMPRQLSVQYGMSYQGVDLGAVGNAAIATASKFIEGDTDVNVANQIAEGAQNATPELALNLAAQGVNTVIQAAGFAGGVDSNSLAALVAGKTLNPFREITFKGANYRNHNFSVKMVARNKAEENEIKQIVNTLRYYMHPSLSNGSGGGFSGGNNRWLGIPSYFDLAFVRMGGSSGNQKRVKLNSATEIEDLYRPGACVLKNFSVNFAPDGQYVATEDYVMAVQIQMSFQETVMLHREALKELKEYS
jgi:hypothetical protein